MTVTRAIAATAIFAGLAVGTASTAWAESPTMSGHYIETSTTPNGVVNTQDWYVTPCGDGCVSVARTAGGPAVQARLVNGQWTLDTSGTAICPEGNKVPFALSMHYTWDPNTLTGLCQTTANVPVCGNPAGVQETNNIQLRQAP
jgi:hypothetical protein